MPFCEPVIVSTHSLQTSFARSQLGAASKPVLLATSDNAMTARIAKADSPRAMPKVYEIQPEHAIELLDRMPLRRYRDFVTPARDGVADISGVMAIHVM